MLCWVQLWSGLLRHNQWSRWAASREGAPSLHQQASTTGQVSTCPLLDCMVISNVIFLFCPFLFLSSVVFYCFTGCSLYLFHVYFVLTLLIPALFLPLLFIQCSPRVIKPELPAHHQRPWGAERLQSVLSRLQNHSGGTASTCLNIQNTQAIRNPYMTCSHTPKRSH